MPQTLILAKNIQEGHQYAKAAGLGRFTYRTTTDSGAIRATRNGEIHLLSSFLKLPNRHAVMGALRNARGIEVLFVEFVDGKIIGDKGNAPEVETRYRLDEKTIELAFRANSIFSTESDNTEEVSENDDTEEAPELDNDTPAPVDKSQVKRAPRRKRCTKCGALVDDIDNHECFPADFFS